MSKDKGNFGFSVHDPFNVKDYSTCILSETNIGHLESVGQIFIRLYERNITPPENPNFMDNTGIKDFNI